MTLGEKLKYYRTAAELKQSEIAAKIGVSQNAVSSWETNRTEPNLSQLALLCKILDCSMSELTNTRPQNVGEVSIEDVLVRISMMSPDELKAVEQAVKSRRSDYEEIKAKDRETELLKLRLTEMQKRLDDLEANKPKNGG